MNASEAMETLGLSANQVTNEGIQSAYIEKVKEARESERFEERLKQLNIARDTLNVGAPGTDLIVQTQSLFLEIQRKQELIAVAQDAKQELSVSVRAAGKRRSNRVKLFRDIAGALTALAAALTFGRENILGYLPESLNTTTVDLFALVALGYCGFGAFYFNRSSSNIVEQFDEINRYLVRAKTVRSILGDAFQNESLVSEEALQNAVEKQISERANRRLGLFDLFETSFLFGGVSRSSEIDEIVSGYVDFLVKSGHIQMISSADREIQYQQAK